MDKKIYTSNFARNGNNPNAIAISLIVPDWFEGKHFQHLAPLKNMVGRVKYNKDKSYEQRQYERDYIDLLKHRNINAQRLIEQLPDNSILLCYESPGDFCHRRILAEWVERHTGFIIQEWKTKKELELEKHDKMVDSIIGF